jgi:hypothetical protein
MPEEERVMADPPFYRYAAKFLLALATAVVEAGATILAAVDDDHVSGKEWAAIVLAVLAGVIGPGLVYRVENAVKRKAVPVDGSAAAARAYPPKVVP